jgi:hypothetical protein
MATANEPKEGRVWPFIVAGLGGVIFTTPGDLMILLWSWSLVRTMFGSDYAENNSGLIILIAVVINGAIFLSLCAGIELMFRLNQLMEGGTFVTERRIAIVIVLLLQLGYLLWRSVTIGMCL